MSQGGFGGDRAAVPRAASAELTVALTDILLAERRQVLASLTRLTGDLGIAEDAVQDAAISALQAWPRTGIPQNPRAWLIVTAKHRAIDVLRREGSRWAKEREAALMQLHQAPDDFTVGVLRDDQLRLIFTCCHPALAAEAQVALSLRVLCGLSVAEVARALLVPEATMAKRLTRARQKIAAAGVHYRVPDDADLPDRMRVVATTVFLLFTEGYASRSAGTHERRSLAEEAVRLGRLLVQLLPGEAVLEGLLATMLLQHSRRHARFDAAGDIVLLADQDRARWDHVLATEGVELAASAIRRSQNSPERFAVVAAIAACHAIAGTAQNTDWDAIVAWYDVLARLDPSPVVLLNRAAALAERGDVRAALDAVETLEGLDDYFWLHATLAELLRRLGREPEAAVAAARARGLTGSIAQQRLLDRRYLAP
ncbi:sigma-70 family RNA polymerase sigma factor [Cryobacterium sp. PH31-O1]|uniref:RNA polymerase sigma factor n=1 Tax=Cryobacterium sp. PH31-O1 TaxID=3046306 RepID=UPI0024B8FCBF|nr:sigma-70 family RNA polymerase sigma factor [Cryobacterium sp. PH31-O1]MDJ0339636.1 sigma-70 family RNA polymerase sigma factor [Cryobacterium sp. PH31-O1]